MALLDVEIDLLRAFVAVVESGSFTSAAEVIGRSQSAVSQKILRLEEILDIRVFERTSRSLNLTREGEHLLISARRMLAHYDGFLREVRSPSRVKLLRLGISENLVPTQLPRLLSQFTSLHPEVQLELSTGLSHQLLAEHEAGQLDIVIAKRKMSNVGKGRVIWREPLVWMTASDYQINPLAPLRLVMMRPPCAYRAIMIETLAEVKREWVSACLASNLMGVQAAVCGGLGVTALGASFLQQGMSIVDSSIGLPSLPSTEVAVIGDDPNFEQLTQPLVSILTQGLMSNGHLT